MGKEQEKENKETNTKEEEINEENVTGEDTGTTEEASKEKQVYDEAYIENLKATMEAEKAAAVEAAKKELEDKAAEEAKLSGMVE